MGKKELNSQSTDNVDKKEEKTNTNIEGKSKPKNKNKYDIVANIHPDDAKDKVFVAIIKALVKNGNTPSTPKELSQYILKHKLTNLGGSTPFATVSSRISQHFKKCSEHKPGHSPRPPLLGKKSFDGMHSRKLYYFIDSPYIEVKDIPNPLIKLAAQKAEAKGEKKTVSDTPSNKKKEKAQPRVTRSRSSAKSSISSDNDTLIENKAALNKIKTEKEIKKEDDDTDNDDDEDNESLIKIKEKIQNSKKNDNSDLSPVEEKKNSKKHGIENSNVNKTNKHQKISNDIQKNDNKKQKKLIEKEDKMEIESSINQTKKEVDPNITQNFDNKPDELIRQLSSDINDLVSVSLISSKPNDLEMELLSDYSSDFSVSTSHMVSTEQDPEGLNTMNNKPWNVPPELMSMNELDSLFSESDLDDITTVSEDSKSVDSSSTNKRKFDKISASDSDSVSVEPKKVNTSVVSNFLKKNHIKKASGLSHEITNDFSDSESASKADSISDNKSDNTNKIQTSSDGDSEKSETIELNSIKEKSNDNEKTNNLMQTNKDITIKKESEPIKSDSVEKPTEKVESSITDSKDKNVVDKLAPSISIDMFYPSSKELVRIFTEAHTNIEYNNYHVKLRKIIHGKLNGDIVFFKKPYNCFSEISGKENELSKEKLNEDVQLNNDLEMKDVDINNENNINLSYKLDKINTDISCSGFVDVSSLFSKEELNKDILQKCHEKIKTKSTEFMWWEQYINNIIEWSNYINSRLSLSLKMKELLKNTKVEIEDVNTMKKANVIVVCLIKNKTNLLKSTNEPESLHRYKSLNVFSNMSLDISYHSNNENEERSIIVIQHSDTWKGVWIPNNYFRILVEHLNLGDYLHSFLTNKVKNKPQQSPVKDEIKSKDTPISSEITPLNLKLHPLNDLNYFDQSFIKYEETEDNIKKSSNKGKSKSSKDNKNSDTSTSGKSKTSNKGASSNETSKSSNIPKTAPRLPFKLPNFDVTKLTLIHSRPATDPAIWITLIENVKVYMCLIPVNMDILETSDSTMTPPLIPLLRIYNNDMVNGTLLLTAGGVESEQNRSIILSLESKRVRIRKHTNGLCGTWIPLNRARELARTCSLDSKLSVFLSDNLRDYFAYNEGVPAIPLPLTLGNPLLDINKSMAVAALSSLNATAAVTAATSAASTSTTAATTASTTSSTKASTTSGKSKEIPISMKAPNPFQTALNLLSSNHLLLNKGNILGNNPLFSNPSALSLLFKQFPFSPMSLPTTTTPKVSIASNSKKNNSSQSQKAQSTKSSTPSTTTSTTTAATTAAATTATTVPNATAIAASLTTTATTTDFPTIPTLPLTFPSIATTTPLSSTSTTDAAGFHLAFENSVTQIGKNNKPSSISQLMKTTSKMKKMKSMPVRITKNENDMLNSTLASLTNEKFQNSFLNTSPDKNKENLVTNDNSYSSNENSEKENDQNLLFLSSSSSEEEDNNNEDVAFLSRDGYMSEIQENKNDDENDEENLDKDDDDDDDDDDEDEEEEDSYEENEYDDMEDVEYDEDSDSEDNNLSNNSDKNIINVVDDDSSDGYKSDYDNNLENMWYLKPRISGGKSKRLNSIESSDILDEISASEDILLSASKENKKESHSKKKSSKSSSSRKRKLATEKSSHKKSTTHSNKESESHSKKKKKIINSSSNTKLILKQSPEFYSSPPPSKKKKSKTKKSNKKIEIVHKSEEEEEEEESDISIISEHSSYIDVNSSDDNNDLFDPINIMNDDDDDEDFKIDYPLSDMESGSGKKIIIRKPSNNSTSSKKAKTDNKSNASYDKKIKSITIELPNKNEKSTKRHKKSNISRKQNEQPEFENKKDNMEPILPLSINIKRKRVTKKSSTTVTSDSQQSNTSSKLVSDLNNSNDNDSDSSIINVDDSSNFNNSTNGQSSPSQISSSIKVSTSEEDKIRAAIINNINLTQEPTSIKASTITTNAITTNVTATNVTTTNAITTNATTTNTITTNAITTNSNTINSTSAAVTTVPVPTSSSVPTKPTKSRKFKATTTAPPSTENLSPSILKAIKNSQNLALLPEFQAELKAPSKKRSKKQSYNEALSLLNNPFLFPAAIPSASTTTTSKSKLVNIKPKDNQIYPNYNLLNEKLSLLKKMNKPIILPKFPIPMLPNQGTKPPYNLLDTSSAFPNQFDLSKAAAELLSGSALPLDNKLASSFNAASTSTALPSTATSSLDTTASSALPATLQSLANNLVFQSIPASVMASTLPKPNISQAQIQSLRKRTKGLKNKENVEEEDEEIDIVSDDGFDDFR